jgi:predicted neuraminidase
LTEKAKEYKLEIKSCEKKLIFSQPKPFASCHASTLVQTGQDSFLCAWFGGSKEGADDVDIWSSSFRNGEWSSPAKIAWLDGVPLWNPVLFKAGNDIILFYKAGKPIPQWYTLYKVSYDNGLTWTEEKELVPGDRGGRGPVKNKPIRLKSGRIVAPASVEAEFWDAFADISDDGGIHWRKSRLVPVQHETLASKGIIQPSLWQSRDGEVHMFLRSTEGKIFRSDSKDEGETWSPAYDSGLPNNNSGLDLVMYDPACLALVYNPVGDNWGARTPLWLSFSEDEGKTWEKVLTLEEGPGEFSYPTIIAGTKTLYISYTWKRQSIAFWKIQL